MKSQEFHNFVAEVESVFSTAPPNGWLLHWDRSRHFGDFSMLVAPLAAVNQTSFDYQFCNWFDVELPRTDGGTCVLTVMLSYVVPAASMHWTEYAPSRRQGAVVEVPSCDGSVDLQRRVERWVTDLGFVLLPVDEQAVVVGVTSLDLCEGDATLGRCLFVDHA